MVNGRRRDRRPPDRRADAPTRAVLSADDEHASTGLTSNKGFEEWGEVFGDEVMATALVDRLVHHCHLFTIWGRDTGCANTRVCGNRCPRCPMTTRRRLAGARKQALTT
jgi:hypothetical protein